jgi:hypothetical protein
MPDKKPTLKQIVEQVLLELDGPTTVKDLAERVYAIYPTRAKTAMLSLRNCLRYEEQGKNLVYLSRDTLLPIRLAIPGVRFRVPIDRHVEKEGIIPVYLFDYFLPNKGKPSDIIFVNQEGGLIPVRTRAEKNIWQGGLLLFARTFADVFDFGLWFQHIQPRRGDSLLVTIQDWDNKTYLLELEPQKRKQIKEAERINREFSDILYGMLEESPRGYISSNQVILDAYMRLSNPRGYPGDNWHDVVARDKRVQFDGILIQYAEDLSPFDGMMLEEDEPLPWIKDTYTKKESNQVYRFKVLLGSNPSIWRVIEMKAEHTFADLDRAIRQAFGHDTFDHLGGFWKLIPRGKSRKRFREVEIGDVNPMEEGSAADLHIGGVDLKSGDLMKYVYDFGDWIEHEIQLEGISAAEAGKSYPVEVARNEPKYQYCVVCKSKGKETIATSICLQCSTEKKLVVLCDDCAFEKHEGHYVEEIVY